MTMTEFVAKFVAFSLRTGVAMGHASGKIRTDRGWLWAMHRAK